VPVAADVAVPAEEFVIGEVLEGAGQYRAELTRFVPLRDEFVPYLWVAGADPEHVTAALRDHPHVAGVTSYDGTTGWVLYELEWSGPMDDLLAVLMEQGVGVSRARGTQDAWEFELLASDGDELAAVQDACRANDLPVEFRSVSESAPTALDRIDLTDDQREMLLLAHERGYFEVPQGATVTDLSEELGISPQAGSKRLRRALEDVVDHLLADRS
jgi:predicted DNA binding protein